MKVGLDFWNCISQFPDHYREMARALMACGNEVHVISAYGDRQLAKYENDVDGYRRLIESYQIPCSALHLVYFDLDDKKIPELKWEIIAKYGIDVMIDDNPRIVAYLHERGVMALQQPKPIKLPK